jgi:hypothetical protein
MTFETDLRRAPIGYVVIGYWLGLLGVWYWLTNYLYLRGGVIMATGFFGVKCIQQIQ